MGALKERATADALVSRVKGLGYPAHIFFHSSLYKVQAGVYSTREDARKGGSGLSVGGLEWYAGAVDKPTRIPVSDPRIRESLQVLAAASGKLVGNAGSLAGIWDAWRSGASGGNSAPGGETASLEGRWAPHCTQIDALGLPSELEQGRRALSESCRAGMEAARLTSVYGSTGKEADRLAAQEMLMEAIFGYLNSTSILAKASNN